MTAHTYAPADIERIARQLGGARKNGAGWDCRCPAHDDQEPSLSPSVSEGGRLRALGLVASTNPQGAGKWRPEYVEFLSGKRVVVLTDNDEAGRKHAGKVAASLRGKAASVKMLELPGLPEKGDASDWLDAG